MSGNTNSGTIAGFLVAIPARAATEATRGVGASGLMRVAFWDGVLRAAEKFSDVANGEDPKDALDAMAEYIDGMISKVVGAENDAD